MESTKLYNVVIEISEFLIRGGIAGESTPRFIIANNFPKTSENINLRNNYLVVVRSLFIDYLKLRSKDSRVLIIEDILSPQIMRDNLFSVLIEEMHVQAISFQPDLTMPMLTTGWNCGIVIDIGRNESRALAICHGQVIMSSFCASPVGISHCAKRFIKQYKTYTNINKNGDNNNVDVDDSVLKEICYQIAVATSDELIPSDILCGVSSSCRQSFTVPGWMRNDCIQAVLEGCMADSSYYTNHSSSVEVESPGSVEPEIQIHLSDMVLLESEDEVGGVVGLLLKCLQKCNMDVRSVVCGNIVVTGEGTVIPGVANQVIERAIRRIKNDTSPNNAYKILIPLCPQENSYAELPSRQNLKLKLSPSICRRDYLTWVGASVFASLKNSSQRYIQRDDFLKLKNNENSQFTLPDWMSTNPKDWKFYGRVNTEESDATANKSSASYAMGRNFHAATMTESY